MNQAARRNAGHSPRLSSQQQTSFTFSECGTAPARSCTLPSPYDVTNHELCWARRALFRNRLNAICSIREGLHAELTVFSITWSKHKR